MVHGGFYSVELHRTVRQSPYQWSDLCGSVTGTVYWHGRAWVGENIPGAKTVFFEESGHMLFWEEPGRFNWKVTEFVQEH